MASAAQLLARRLHRAGCRRAYGIPGGEVLTVLRALEAEGIEFVLARHENCAGFMAEGGHHHDGAPGVLVATLGPGVANAVNVVANAWQDRVPLIFLTGCVEPREAAGYAHQVFDHRALLAPVTKASLTLVDGAADLIADRAVALALDGQPGPVHVDVPMAAAGAEHPGPERPDRARPAAAAPAPGPDLERARGWLAAAERPLVIAGVDVLEQGADAALREFVLARAAPLITTYKAKGVLDEAHRLALGGAGLSPRADRVLLPLVERSDLVVLAGYDPIEMRAGWCSPWPAGHRVIEFSTVPPTHQVHHASLLFAGDVGAGLAALGEGVEPRATWAGGEPDAARAALAEAFAAAEEWGPAALVETARRVLPAETVATVDSGAHRILLSQMWRCHAPRTLLQSTGLCTMGCALPLAIGYKRAAPERPVVAFSGDAGLEMVLGELSTLRDLALPVIVVVFVDRALALIDLKQHALGHPRSGVAFGATDFPAVARGFGMHGAWVDDREGLERELHAALARAHSTLLACRIGEGGYQGRF